MPNASRSFPLADSRFIHPRLAILLQVNHAMEFTALLSLSLRRSSSNFLFAKISSSSRKAKQNNCNLVGQRMKKGRKEKGRKGGIGNGEEDGDRRVQLIGPGTSCPSSSTLDSWESRPPQASSVASSFCATIRRFFFIQKRFLAIPFLDPYPTLVDRSI